MSPNLVGTRADRDIPLPANVRRYYIAGVRHGGGPGGFAVEGQPEPAACSPRTRTRRPRPTARSMHALVDWVVKDAPPPPSRYPRLDRGDLVPPDAGGHRVSARSPASRCPTASSCRSTSTTSGQASMNADVSGVVSLQPPVVRADAADARAARGRGRQRDWLASAACCIEAPLGTYTGWNPIASGFFKGQIQSLGGGYIPFAKTKAERLAVWRSAAVARGALRLARRLRGACACGGRASGRTERFLLQDDADRLVGEAEKSDVLK